MASSDTPPTPSRPGRTADSGSRWFGELGLVDFQIEMFDRILARNPNDISILRALGELLALRGQNERSLEIDRRLVALAPRDCVARYNLACRLAVQGSTGPALEELGRACSSATKISSTWNSTPISIICVSCLAIKRCCESTASRARPAQLCRDRRHSMDGGAAISSLS